MLWPSSSGSVNDADVGMFCLPGIHSFRRCKIFSGRSVAGGRVTYCTPAGRGVAADVGRKPQAMQTHGLWVIAPHHSVAM